VRTQKLITIKPRLNEAKHTLEKYKKSESAAFDSAQLVAEQ
jgi:hypothetical protein